MTQLLVMAILGAYLGFLAAIWLILIDRRYCGVTEEKNALLVVSTDANARIGFVEQLLLTPRNQMRPAVINCTTEQNLIDLSDRDGIGSMDFELAQKMPEYLLTKFQIIHV